MVVGHKSRMRVDIAVNKPDSIGTLCCNRHVKPGTKIPVHDSPVDRLLPRTGEPDVSAVVYIFRLLSRVL